MKIFSLLLVNLGLFSHLALAAPKNYASLIQAAIDDPARLPADREADAERHPFELLQFSHIKPGDTVVDFLPGRGYFTRLFSKIVGPNGKVIAFVPQELADAKFKPVDSAREAAKGYSNVTVEVAPLLKMKAHGVNVFWTSLNYHDLHTKGFAGMDIGAFDREVFQALRKNGVYVVVDHAAAAGTPLTEADHLHRIDPALVTKEVITAGFSIAEESGVLKHPADTHSLPVFDPSIKGKTDQFAFRFEKSKN